MMIIANNNGLILIRRNHLEERNWRDDTSYKSWKLADTYLVFVQTEERFLDVPYHRSRVGLNHLAFYAESREHVDDITRKLKEKV